MDKPLNPEGSSRYSLASDLHHHHWQSLLGRKPEEAAQAADCQYADGVFTLPLAGSLLLVDPEKRLVRYKEEGMGDPGFQRALVAVSYLANALDVPVSEKFISPRELKGGEPFFRGPHAIPSKFIADRFHGDPAKLLEEAKKLGGVPSQGADVSVVVVGLPKIPLKIMVWGSDGEMSGEATMLVDSRAGLHIPLDVLWALLNVVSYALCRKTPA